MKKITVTFVLLLGIASAIIMLPSCEKAKELAKFDVKMTLPTVSVPITQAEKSGLTEQYFQFSQYVNVDSIKAAHGLSNLTLENGTVTGAIVTITAPTGANLAFLNSARVTLFTTANNELQIGHTGTVNPAENSVQLILDVADITPFLSNQVFSGRLYYDVNYALLPAPTVLLGLANTVQFTVSPF
jgi:hypothetical protein